MAAQPVTRDVTLTLTGEQWASLTTHLFPGDRDEHGAVIKVGVSRTPRGIQLLARDLVLARDAIDYVAGERGYRMLTSAFVTDCILDCADDNLGYLAVHCHGGQHTVGFSADDLASHERGYPALREIANGQIVGGLVFARHAVAGDIWLPDGSRVRLTSMRVAGRPIDNLYPSPPAPPATADPSYDRQARLFGDRGQQLLRQQKVGVIGAGGAGSLLIEYLSRLGVGQIIAVDPDRLDITNHPRVVGSRLRDARPWMTAATRPTWLQRLGRHVAVSKVKIAHRVARQANPRGNFHGERDTLIEPRIAEQFRDCDYLFLAADTMQARLIFNALVHQYLIPGVQVGAKVTSDKTTGAVLDVFAVTRPVTPDLGCLWCNGLILPDRLAEEALTDQQRQAQRYVDDPTVTAPSVITLNALAAAHAANDYLFTTLGLLDPAADHRYVRVLPREGDVVFEQPRKDPDCIDCGRGIRSRLARGDSARMPTRASSK